MYGVMGNLCQQLLVQEPIRASNALGHPPFSFHIRGALGLPEQVLRVPIDELGFLADSREPDILNRVLVVEQAFVQMLFMIRHHQKLHAELQNKIHERDPAGEGFPDPHTVLGLVGQKLLIEIDDAIAELKRYLPETRDAILLASQQLRETLRSQFPTRHFARFEPIARPIQLDKLPPLPKAAAWRRAIRRAADALHMAGRPRYGDPKPPPQAAEAELTPAEIIRFPPRSFRVDE